MKNHRLLAQGFSLVELSIAVVAASVLGFVGFSWYQSAIDDAMCTKDVVQLRQIGTAVIARANDNAGYLYSKEEIGNSSYRVYNDKLSLCQILLPYLNSKSVWTSPRPHPRTVAYGNSYAWTRNETILSTPMHAINSISNTRRLSNTLILWNNHSFITPSPMNYPDPSPNGGPSNASAANQKKPWKRGTAQNWLYLDGHIETR